MENTADRLSPIFGISKTSKSPFPPTLKVVVKMLFVQYFKTSDSVQEEVISHSLEFVSMQLQSVLHFMLGLAGDVM